MAKHKLVVQASSVIRGLYRAKDLTPAEQQMLRGIALSDRPDLAFPEDPAALDREIVDAAFLVTENQPRPAALIQRATRLRLIQNSGLRHHAIDHVAARRAGIPAADNATLAAMAAPDLAAMAILPGE